MRIVASIVLLCGLASIVLGILLMVQASAGQDELEESIAPLMVSQVEGRYDEVVGNHNAMRQMAEMAIQRGGDPPPLYNYLSAQRASLGLAKANIGTVKATRMNGIIDIVVGAGLVLAGVGLFRRPTD